MNKFLIATLLAMCVIGFSMSGVSAKSETFTNTMEVGKTYYVYASGRPYMFTASTSSSTAGWYLNPGINMYYGAYVDYISAYQEPKRCIFIQCYNPGQNMLTADRYEGLWTEPVVDLTIVKNIYLVKPLKAGEYWTKTQHSSGDKTYHWKFVDTNYGGR